MRKTHLFSFPTYTHTHTLTCKRVRYLSTNNNFVSTLINYPKCTGGPKFFNQQVPEANQYGVAQLPHQLSTIKMQPKLYRFLMKFSG